MIFALVIQNLIYDNSNLHNLKIFLTVLADVSYGLHNLIWCDISNDGK